ncbi:MAG TPA: cysteine desulfurase family protein [Candidatus Binatus sp.]|nr:cysteine desulfurase family protein [Candidatus Binatus sp.]
MAVYLDNAATTPLRTEALDAMLPFLRADYANPSSAHSAGQRARRALDNARERTAAVLGVRADEIIFTGGGSEADCTAIFGLCAPGAGSRRRFITSAIEHHAVLHAAEAVREGGHSVTILPVDVEGFVHADALEEALRDVEVAGTERATTLVSIMHANNEIGTIEPIARLAAIAHEHGALFHTDAVQTVGHIPLDVGALGVDALSLSAHKFEGPKGVGALYVRNGLTTKPLIVGGTQEGGRRAGTENVAGIVGLAVALELAVSDVELSARRTAALRDQLIDGALTLPGVSLNGPRHERVPNNANLRFEGIEAQTMVLALDLAGFEVSTGSACTSGSLEPSHVLSALGQSSAHARGAVRFTLGRTTSADDIACLLSRLGGTIQKLRALAGALEPGGGLTRVRE